MERELEDQRSLCGGLQQELMKESAELQRARGNIKELVRASEGCGNIRPLLQRYHYSLEQ